jgi:hypothetical protein
MTSNAVTPADVLGGIVDRARAKIGAFPDLSTKDLAKLITDEYALILATERSYLLKALSLGEKLIALRPRIAPDHGQWQAKLAEWCPGISYEKANLCIRFVENMDKLEAHAASKNVKITDLGVDEARAVLAKPKAGTKAKPGTDAKAPALGKPTPEAMKARELANAEAEAKALAARGEDAAKEWLKALAVDELVVVLREVFDAEYIGKLARAITLPSGQASMGPSVGASAGIERRA